jgi:cytochrome c-type biogenesis protein CcmE
MKNRRWFYLVGGLIVVVGLAVILLNVFQSYSIYYYTVDELKSQGEKIYGEQIRVTGKVADGSADYDVEKRLLTFAITDGNTNGAVGSLPMTYEGIRPNNFDEGIEVVVEGKYGATGVFTADQIITKCPSKYEPTS